LSVLEACLPDTTPESVPAMVSVMLVETDSNVASVKEIVAVSERERLTSVALDSVTDNVAASEEASTTALLADSEILRVAVSEETMFF
jgi:hypothetical protein